MPSSEDRERAARGQQVRAGGVFVLGVVFLIAAVVTAGGESASRQHQAEVLLLGLIGVAALAEAYRLYVRSLRQTGQASRRDNGLPELAGASRWLVVVGAAVALGSIAYLVFAAGTSDESGLSGPGEPETPQEFSIADLDFGDTLWVGRDGESEVTLDRPTPATCPWPVGCDDPEIGERVVQVPIRIKNVGSTAVAWSADYFVLEYPDGTRTTWDDGATSDYGPADTLNGDQPKVQPGATYEGVLFFEAPFGPFQILILTNPDTVDPFAAWGLAGPIKPEPPKDTHPELDFGDTVAVSRDGTSEVTLDQPTLGYCVWPEAGCDDPEIGERIVRVPVRIKNSGSTPVAWSADYFVLEFPDGTRTTWDDGATFDYEPADTLNDHRPTVQPGATYEGVLVFEAPKGPFQVLLLTDPGDSTPFAGWTLTGPVEPETPEELEFGDTFSVSRDGTSEVTLDVPTLATCQWPDIGCDDPTIGQRVVQVPVRIKNSGSEPVVWSSDYFVLEFPDGTRTTWLDGVTYDYEPSGRTLEGRQEIQPGATYEGVVVLEAPSGPFQVLVVADRDTFEPVAAWS